MTTLAAAITALVMVATGLVLFRRAARWLLAGDDNPPVEGDLLLIGVLPGLALLGCVLTYLALAHLLRLWVVVPLIAATFFAFRTDAGALSKGLADSARTVYEHARRGDLFPALAVITGCAVLILGLLLAYIPSHNVDVWVFHMPLAQSFVAHAGMAYPQIDHLHYGNQPLFFELLFGAAMLAVPHYLAADAVNISIFFGLMLLILSFAKYGRGFQFLTICIGFVWLESHILDATVPMIDLPRACMSVAAYLFAYRYACNLRRFDLVMSALLSGAAVAGKYTELLTPIIICTTLIPIVVSRPRAWLDFVPAIAIFLLVSIFWYAKNAILYGNPIFPFVFGHPGLSNQWMADYMLDMTRPFDPADRVYSTNLLTLKGWHDYWIVLQRFSGLRTFAIFSLLSLILPIRRRWMLPLWTVILFIIWYTLMFNATRWAEPAILLMMSTAFMAWFWICDWVAARWDPQLVTNLVQKTMDLLKRHPDPWPALASIALAIFLAFGVVRLVRGHGHFVLPRWMPINEAAALSSPDAMDQYLNDTEPGFGMYRYIGSHDLKYVFQPFDSGGTFYASAYNGGHPNDWVLQWLTMPASATEITSFVAKNNMHYFILPAFLKPVEKERLGLTHVALAMQIVDQLKPHSKVIFRDKFGNALYEILPQAAP